MTDEEIVKQVNDILAVGLEIERDKLVPTANVFEDLGIDSLDAVDLLVTVEKKFGVKVEPEHFMEVRTLGDLYSIVSKMEKARKPVG